MISQPTVPWQPCVLGDWPAVPAKYAFEISLGKMLQPNQASSDDIEVPYIKALNVRWNGITLDDLPTMWASPSDVGKLDLEVGDLLVCEGGEVGRASVLNKEPPAGCIFQNSIHRVRSAENDVRYLMYCLRTASEADWLEVLCNRATIAHFTVEKLREFRICLPDLEIQKQVANYLDRETAHIDALVKEKERMLALLAEKCVALISHAVTRGVNPDAQFRPSGFCWLGDIPKHWECRRLKQVGNLVSGSGFPHEYQGRNNEGVPFLKVSDMSHAGNETRIETWANTVNENDVQTIGASIVPANSIVYAKIGAALLLNRRRILKIPSCIDNNMSAFVPKIVRPMWALYWMSIIDFGLFANPGAIPSFVEGQQKELPFFIPPDNEQRDIIKAISQAQHKDQKLASEVKSSIRLLKERRAALITAAVTGQLDPKEMKP